MKAVFFWAAFFIDIVGPRFFLKHFRIQNLNIVRNKKCYQHENVVVVFFFEAFVIYVPIFYTFIGY